MKIYSVAEAQQFPFQESYDVKLKNDRDYPREEKKRQKKDQGLDAAIRPSK